MNLTVVVSVCVLLVLVRAANAGRPETLYDFLFESRNFPAQLSLSVQVAAPAQDDIAVLTEKWPDPVIFMPTNAAWSEHPDLLHLLRTRPEAETEHLRYLLLMAATVDGDGARSWSMLREAARRNQGILSSLYGHAYMLHDVSANMCITEQRGEYIIEGKCAPITLPPIICKDASIFMTRKILLPPDVELEIDRLLGRYGADYDNDEDADGDWLRLR